MKRRSEESHNYKPPLAIQKVAALLALPALGEAATRGMKFDCKGGENSRPEWYKGNDSVLLSTATSDAEMHTVRGELD